MKAKTIRLLKTTFNVLKAVAIVASPHTFIAKVGEVLSAINACDKRK